MASLYIAEVSDGVSQPDYFCGVLSILSHNVSGQFKHQRIT
jgi:hypothetical protein